MKKVAIVGWRGMVGSVLMERMAAEGDFEHFEPHFFSTSQAGQNGPAVGGVTSVLGDAFDVNALSKMDAVVTCQGGDYTKKMAPELRAAGWAGYWIDAASAKRMDDDAIIVLDPVNRSVIDAGLKDGVKNYIGGNCTVSLMLMGVGGLFTEDLVEWVTSMTYQSASGAGANNMRELVSQMGYLGQKGAPFTAPGQSVLALDKAVAMAMGEEGMPTRYFGAPLAGNVLPWIDSALENGQSKEEWKGVAETNKILGTKTQIPVDGTCVRVGAMRCHSQALTIKLKKDLSVAQIEEIIAGGNQWVEIVPNDRAQTIARLTPAHVTGKLDVAVGRIRKMNMGPTYLNVFTVGDQLLWGAAEPIRRMLRILLDFLK